MPRPLSLLPVVLLVACGASAPSNTTPAGASAPIATADPTPSSAPTPQLSGCAQEIALSCEEGFVDGCLSGLTLEHVCVLEGDTDKTPCAQEIARVCPEGAMDACLRQPAVAETHLCIAK